MRALELLYHLGAIDEEGNLTGLGVQMSLLPLDPELSKMLLSGGKNKCMNEILTLVSMLSSQNPFLRPKEKVKAADEAKSKFEHQTGDHFTLLIAYNLYKLNGSTNEWCKENFINQRAMKAADDVRTQLNKILVKMNIDVPETNSYITKFKPKREKNIIKCLIEGYFAQVAFLELNGYYITVKDDQYVFIHPSSTLVNTKPKWLLFNEFVLTSKNFVRTVTAVNPRLLLEIAGEYYDMDSMKKTNYKKEFEKIMKVMQREEEEKEEEEDNNNN